MTRQNWLYWHKALDVSRILQIAEEHDKQQATTFNDADTSYRSSKISWLTGNQEIFDMISPFAQEAAQIMQIQVQPIADIQYTEYLATENGKYDWHHDVDWNNNNGYDRKLSLTVQLTNHNDYEGGVFEFAEVEQPSAECRDKGTVLIFPSYLQHRVTPVTYGVRKTLVAWFEGPKWQ